MKQYAALDDTVYFWFAANDTSGSGGDGASPAADVRLAGAAADAAPVYSPTPVLLSHANYPAGAYEIAIAATAANGFAVNNTYALFCTLAIDAQNPTGFVGSFDLKPVEANVTQLLDTAWLTPGVAGTPDVNTKLLGGTAQTGNDVGADVNDILTDTGTTLDTLIKDVPTVAEFEARSIEAANYVVVGNTIAGVTAVTNDVGITQAGADKVWGTAARALTDKAGFALSAAGITAIWEKNVSAFSGAGYAGTYIKTLYDDWINGGRLDNLLDAVYTGTPPTVNAISDQVWDEVLTGATHNIATSAGRRLRQAADVMIIREETCQAGGGNDEIIFDAGASAVDEFYINDLVVLTSGTGVGQQRHIDSYVGSSKTATVNRDWTTNPDATTGYTIKADSTKHVHGFETEAKAEIESEVNDALVALGLDSLNDITAASVWAVGTRALSTPADYKADVSALALEATLTAIKGSGWSDETLKAIKAAIDTVSSAAIVDAVWDELQSEHVIAGSFGKYLDTEVSSVGGVGSGALSCTWTQKDDSDNPLDNVQIWISTDEAGTNVIAGTLLTDASGEATFMLDAGTYYVWRERAGYNFTNPQTWSVS